MSTIDMSGISSVLPRVDRQMQTKIIPISVGYGVIKEVPINKNSGLLFNLHLDTIHEEPYNLTQYLTTGSKWSTSIDETSVTIYVQFLLGNQTTIIDRNILVSCFLIYSLLEDTNFFNFLLTQLHQRWTLLSQILYNSEDYVLPHDVKEDIFLHVPQMLLPNKYINDKVFMNNWITKYNQQTITLNNNSERFTTTNYVQTIENSLYDKTTDSYYDTPIHEQITNNVYVEPSTINNEGNMVEYYSKFMSTISNINNSCKLSQEKRYNGQVEGEQIDSEWDDNSTNIKYENVTTYVNGQQMGPHVQYVNGNIIEEEYIENGNPIGDSKRYFNNGQLELLTHYASDEQSITFSSYHENGNLRYVIRNKEGVNGSWYNDYKLEYLDDGSVVESNQQRTLFYDARGHITRKITNPDLSLPFEV